MRPCQVRGYGLSADAHHITQPEPGGRGAMLAMQRALDASGLGATSVAYINAHATSTPLGDAVEAAAIAEVCSMVAATDAEEATTHLTSSPGLDSPPGTVGLFAFWQTGCCLSRTQWAYESLLKPKKPDSMQEEHRLPVTVILSNCVPKGSSRRQAGQQHAQKRSVLQSRQPRVPPVICLGQQVGLMQFARATNDR